MIHAMTSWEREKEIEFKLPFEKKQAATDERSKNISSDSIHDLRKSHFKEKFK